jgi:hypothetical protein
VTSAAAGNPTRRFDALDRIEASLHCSSEVSGVTVSGREAARGKRSSELYETSMTDAVRQTDSGKHVAVDLRRGRCSQTGNPESLSRKSKLRDDCCIVPLCGHSTDAERLRQYHPSWKSVQHVVHVTGRAGRAIAVHVEPGARPIADGICRTVPGCAFFRKNFFGGDGAFEYFSVQVCARRAHVRLPLPTTRLALFCINCDTFSILILLRRELDARVRLGNECKIQILPKGTV